MTIFILAGNYKEAREYAELHSIPRRDWHPIDGAEQCFQLGPESDVRRVGTYYLRPDLAQVNEAIRRQGCPVAMVSQVDLSAGVFGTSFAAVEPVAIRMLYDEFLIRYREKIYNEMRKEIGAETIPGTPWLRVKT